MMKYWEWNETPYTLIKRGDLVYDKYHLIDGTSSSIGLVVKSGLPVEGVEVLWSNGNLESWDHETFCLYYRVVDVEAKDG